MKAEIVTHFQKDDVGCNGDYCGVELFLDGKLVKKAGDYYHDKGDIVIRAFLEGVEHAIGEPINVIRTNVADRKY